MKNLVHLPFNNIVCLLLFLLNAAINVSNAEESIAAIEQFNARFSETSGNSEVEILAIATLLNISVNGLKVSELSGLAWDDDENILYALSDNGYLLHLRPVLDNEKLVDVVMLAGYALLDDKNKPLKYKESDSEGLSVLKGNNGIKKDTELIIAFERIPRLIIYTPEGVISRKITLPESLANIQNYQSENKSLEAVAVNNKLGILVGPERALRDQDETLIYIYSVTGSIWYNIPLKNKYYGALVDMTTMPDDSLLLLERSYGGLFPSMETTLHRFIPGKDQNQSELIYSFSHENDLINNNFEGITYFKNNKYFMVSDDNNHPFKDTQLVYFSITEKADQ